MFWHLKLAVRWRRITLLEHHKDTLRVISVLFRVTLLHVSVEAELKIDTYTHLNEAEQNGTNHEIIVRLISETMTVHEMMILVINNDVSCSGCPGWSQKILETLLHVSVEAELKMDTYTPKRSKMISEMKLLSTFSKFEHSTQNDVLSFSRCPGWSQKILETLLHVSVEAKLKINT